MKYRRISLIFVMFLLLALFPGCGMEASERSDKPIIEVHNLWADFSFEEACDIASTIVIGTVSSVADARTVAFGPPNTDMVAYDVYTDAVISVEYTLKGEDKDSVVCIQQGGELDDRIYMVDGVELLKEGDRVLVFLDANNHVLTPIYLRLIDENEKIQTHKYPEGYVSTATADSNTISADDYAGLIKDYLEN